MEENKKLTWEEKIARIEQAPKEVQVMVAKAFLREDIDDEDVQYLFNVASPEELNDPEEHYEIENLNMEEPEGIGANGFTMRVSRPANNKNFITTGSGGWNTCIKGNPTYSLANALANCVGYASGRFNEIINLAREISGCTYKHLNCNAVGFKERAEQAGLKIGTTPRKGAIGCCGGGSGAGHVFIVERVDSNNQIYTSESGWGSSSIFWNQIRTNNNGRWGMSSSYYFRCFIYLPDDVQKAIDNGNVPSPSSDIANKSVDELAREVINGKYGNGDARKNALGSRYSEVQKRVNEILAGNKPAPQPAPTPSGDDLLTLVRKTIRGDFGNGQARKNALGSRYSEVQHQVNENVNRGNWNWDKIRLY